MDAVDGEELDAQLLIDKMAELGVIEEGVKVKSFDNKDGVLTLDLSALSVPRMNWSLHRLLTHLSRTMKRKRCP